MRDEQAFPSTAPGKRRQGLAVPLLGLFGALALGLQLHAYWQAHRPPGGRTLDKHSEVLLVPPGSILAGPVTAVPEGEVLEVGGREVRLGNVDCPEPRTPAGQAARDRLARLAGRESGVVCRLAGRQGPGLDVGRCELGDAGGDAGEILIGEGRCAAWR